MFHSHNLVNIIIIGICHNTDPVVASNYSKGNVWPAMNFYLHEREYGLGLLLKMSPM